MLEINLSSLQAVQLPPPHFVLPAKCNLGWLWYFVEFSECGRCVWAVWHCVQCKNHQAWGKIAKSYLRTDERLMGRMPSVWRFPLIYHQNAYRVTKTNGFVILELQTRLGDDIGETPQASVRITSIPSSMRVDYPCLLPGHEEKDLARVLLVPRFGYGKAIVIKVLSVTMKEILAKLDEIAETVRSKKKVLEAPSESRSTDKETTSSEQSEAY